MRAVGLSLAGLLFAGGVAGAANPPDPQCILAAQAKRKGCNQECRDQYSNDVALCRNVDPACFDTCKTQRMDCLAPLIASLDACIDGCNATLQSDKDACPPPGDPNRDACVDAAQVKAFICRDNCREQWHADPNIQTGLHFCRKQFTTCIKGCPPPAGS